MSLEISHREREGVTLLDLKGRITAGEEAIAFREAFERHTGGEAPRLVLNMEHVDYVDSTGLGAMVMCSRRAANANGGRQAGERQSPQHRVAGDDAHRYDFRSLRR